MSEDTKNNPISLRLNDENHTKLENMASKYFLQKSTMASDIIVNVLNENLQELIINHISYPRPILKKIFSMMDKIELTKIIAHTNEYNKGIIETAMYLNSKESIIKILKKWMQKSGCEVNLSSSHSKNVLEVHHEMEKNWSIVTCATTSFIFEVLGYKILRTFPDKDWFKLEYTENEEKS